MDYRYTIATGVIIAVMLVFLAAYSLNAIEQVKHTGQYDLPTSLIDIIRMVLISSIAVLSLGSLSLGRKDKGNGKETDTTTSTTSDDK